MINFITVIPNNIMLIYKEKQNGCFCSEFNLAPFQQTNLKFSVFIEFSLFLAITHFSLFNQRPSVSEYFI